MSGANNDLTITAIIKHLKLRKYGGTPTVLILGSRTGGLFRSESLYDTLKGFSIRIAPLSKLEQFAECYDILTREGQFSANEIHSILGTGLKNVAVSNTDIYLTNLIQLGLFDVVITTNIDSLLEKALEYIGMKEMYDFSIYAPIGEDGKEREIPPLNRKRCQIIKVFGQLTTNKYTIHRYDYWDKRQSFEQQLKLILQRDVMVIGLDPRWDAEFYRVFPLQGGSLWFINEDDADIKQGSISAMSRGRNVHCLAGNEEGNYNYYVYSLYREFIGSLPVTLEVTGLILGELRRLQEEFKKLLEELRKDHPPL